MSRATAGSSSRGGQASGRLHATLLPVQALPSATRDELWHLFAEHYTDVTPERFVADLTGKAELFLLRDTGDGSLQGFSTVTSYPVTVQGRLVRIVYSGDTVIRPAYWGQTALQRAFFRYLVRTKLHHPTCPVYWFLITKGYKTYLLLARNFPTHWPRPDQPTPPWEAALLAEVAGSQFGQAWQPERGVLVFPEPQGRLRDEVAPLGPELLRIPEIRFFAQRNPGHIKGEELCCLGRVDPALLLSFPFKQLRRLMRAHRGPG